MKTRCEEMFQQIPILICFSLSECYKHTGEEEKRELVLKLMSGIFDRFCLESLVYDGHQYWIYMRTYFLLMLEVFENSEKWDSFHYQIYKKFMSVKIKLIEQETKARKNVPGKVLTAAEQRSVETICLLCSCNVGMTMAFKILAEYLQNVGEYPVEIMDVFELSLTNFITTADTIYFSQFLIFRGKPEQAISLLETIVEQEGDFSTSVVIWPKELYGSKFIDDNLRNKLIKSSDDYVVFPSNLYARYLLTMAYRTLGQEENRRNNMAELIVLRERYTQVQEFTPMLKIMSTIVLD